MKVLPLILTLLIIMALALREELRNFRTVKEGRISSFEQIVNFREKRWLVEEDKVLKERQPKNPERESKEAPPKFTSGKGLPRELNIYTLIDPADFSRSPEVSQFLLRTVEKLLNKQFQNAPLYQSLIESDPQLVSHLFEAIREKFPTMEFNIGKMSWKELSLIKLDNDRLQLFFYEILKGEKMMTHTLEKSFLKGESIPLLNALRVDKNKKKTRLFTASPTLLEALINDPKDLLPLLEKRRSISRELNRKKKSRDEKLVKESKNALERQWKEAAKGAGIDLPEELASYEISTTRI